MHKRNTAGLTAANRRRQESAAVKTLPKIRRVLDLYGGKVPGTLAQAGRLRLAHPHVSLQDLANLAEPPMTKDALSRRLARLVCFDADQEK